MTTLKYFISFCMLMAFTTASIAQEASQEEEYKAENAGWLVNIDEAYEVSQKTGKPILANFTGSDWCGWCKKLTSAVFTKPEFIDWAEKNVVLLELDFPRRKKVPQEIQQQNASLQQAFKVQGYPSVWVFHLTKDEKKGYQIDALGKTGYRPSAEEFIQDIENMKAQRKPKG